MSGAKPGRGRRRVPLDRDVIIAAALELAAQGSAVTFRSLGTALGTDPTAVYRHFRDKDDLMRAVADRLMQISHQEIDHDLGWRDQLRTGADRVIDIFVAHPWVGAEVGVLTTSGPGEMAAINWILSQLKSAGLTGRQAVRYYAAYSSYVLSAAASLSGQRLHGQDGAGGSWVGDLRAVDAQRMPALAQLLPELVELSDREVYATGVEVFLDAVEALGRQAGGTSS